MAATALQGLQHLAAAELMPDPGTLQQLFGGLPGLRHVQLHFRAPKDHGGAWLDAADDFPAALLRCSP